MKVAKLNEKKHTIIAKVNSNDFSSVRILASISGSIMVRDGWEIPVTKENILLLQKKGFVLDSGLSKITNGKPTQEKEISTSTKGLVIPDNMKPYPYQVQGVNFIDEKNGRALIADEMGLGKTVQALLWLAKHPEARPAVIVCPSSLKLNWERETHKWIKNANVEILESRTPYLFETDDILIINYEILQAWIRPLMQLNVNTYIFDEAHLIKNPKAQRTKAAKRLAGYAESVIGLTGTPVENRPVEIYNIIHMIDATIFPNYYSFIYRYCEAKRNPFGGIDVGGASNSSELHQKLINTVMIRRKKKDVLKDLPPKQMIQVPLSISNRNDYNKAEKEFIEFVMERYTHKIDEKEVEKELRDYAKRNKYDIEGDLTSSEKTSIADVKIESTAKYPTLPRLKMLEKLAGEGKIKNVLEWIENFLESDEKLVVFAINRFVVDTIIEKFPQAVKIVGGMTPKNKQKAVDDFQTKDEVKLLVANIIAGGVGLTLTAASNVAVIQFPWNPSQLNQAVDRVHRITQTKQVSVWNLVADNTIENRILEVLVQKEKVVSEILDGEIQSDIDMMTELIKSYIKK